MRPLPVRSLVPLAFAVLLPAIVPCTASAVPPIGFREDWPGTSLRGWGGGSQIYDNPGTGGTEGAGDGYLVMSNQLTAYHLGTVNLSAPYPGNWTAAGITRVKVSLKDIGTDDNLSIRFILANQYTTYQYFEGFDPPTNRWAEYIVELAPQNFYRIIGTGNFLEMMAGVDRIHFRHDFAPYIHPPDLIKGDVGIDRLIIGDATTPTVTTSWGRIKSLYRR